jgi:hypothetical protein
MIAQNYGFCQERIRENIKTIDKTKKIYMFSYLVRDGDDIFNRKVLRHSPCGFFIYYN